MVWRQDDGSGTFDVLARHYTALSGWMPAVTVDTQSGDVRAPRVAMDGLGNAWVVWTQDDGSRYNLWGRRYERATESWEAALQLESTDTTFGMDSDAEMAQLAMAADGSAAVVWTQVLGRFWPDSSSGLLARIVHVRGYDPAQGWGSIEAVDAADVANSHDPRVSLNDAGRLSVVWQRYQVPEGSGPGRERAFDVYANDYVPAGGWSGPVVLDTNPGTTTSDDADQADVALDAAGNAIAVWRQEGTDDTIWTARFDEVLGEWESAAQVPAASGTAGFGPVVAMNDAGAGAVAWHESGTVRARVYDLSGGWQPVAGLGPGGMVELSMDGSGRALAVWQYGAGVGWSRYLPASGWSSESSLSASAGGLQGLPALALSPAGEAVLGWQEADGAAGTSVFSRRFAVSVILP